jgi:uncharacterized protein (TIGR03067 family)
MWIRTCRVVLALLAVAVTFSTMTGPSAVGQETKDPLEGTWKFVKVECGKDQPYAKIFKGVDWKFEGGNVSCFLKGKAGVPQGGMRPDKYTTDATKKPAEIDLIYTRGAFKDKKSCGLYELNGDELKICTSTLPSVEKDRPKQIKADGLIIVLHFKRDKQ